MFEDGITADILFNDPLALAKYLDDISGELEVSYVHRKADQIVAHMDTIDQEMVFEVTKKESQLKLLVDIITKLIDTSEERNESQVDAINKLEADNKTLMERKATIQLELEITKQKLETVEQSYQAMEKSFLELEEKYEAERVASSKKKLEVMALCTIKDKYVEAKSEERRRTVSNIKLLEEKNTMEARINVQRDENKRLKELMKTMELDLEAMHKSSEESEKLKNRMEIQLKDYGSERNACITEIQNLRAKLEEANSKCQVVEQELVVARTTSKVSLPIKEETIESPRDNLNLKLNSNITPHNLFMKTRSKSISKESFYLNNDLQPSPDDKNSPMFHFVNVDDIQTDQYDNCRFSISREPTREFGSFVGRKSIVSANSAHVKENRNDQGSWDSNASTQASTKGEKTVVPAQKPSELNTQKSEINSASSTEAPTALTVAKTPAKTETPVTINSKTAPPRKVSKDLSTDNTKRKDTLEEFYLLTWQSVLLNSPNFNDIAGNVDANTIFKEINKLGIPFFQWYSWLNNKVQEVYNSRLLPEIRERKATTILKRKPTKV